MCPRSHLVSGGVWITIFWSFWLQVQALYHHAGLAMGASSSPGPSVHLLKPWPLLCHFSGRFQDPGATRGEKRWKQSPPLLWSLLSGKGAALKVETPSRQKADSLSALGLDCSDRFISSWVPAIRCKTQAFVCRGKAAAKRLLDTLSERPGAGFLGEAPTWPTLLTYSFLLVFSHSQTPNLLFCPTVFRDIPVSWLLSVVGLGTVQTALDEMPPYTRAESWRSGALGIRCTWWPLQATLDHWGSLLGPDSQGARMGEAPVGEKGKLLSRTNMKSQSIRLKKDYRAKATS